MADQMTHATPITVTANGLTLAALAWGDSGKPPLLALHGWLDNAASFECLAPLLSSHYVVAIDMAGHGHSSHRGAGASYYVSDYVLDAAQVPQALGWERYTLMGHSLGAGVATMLAATQLDVIEKLILLDGAGPLTSPAAETPKLLRNAVADSLADTGAATEVAELSNLIERRQRASQYLEAEDVERLVRRNAKRDEGIWTWRYDQRLKLTSPMRLDENGVQAALAAIECNVLLLTASAAWVEGMPTFEERRAKISKLEHHSLSGHHHMHMSSNCNEVAQHIIKFLSATD